MINKKRLVVSSIIILIVSALYTFLTCGWLFKWIYNIEPKIWLSPSSMTSVYNIILSNLVGFLTILFFATIYALIYSKLPLKTFRRGALYGFFIWLVGPFTGIISMPFYMTISWGVIIYWIFSRLIIYLIMGALLGQLYEVGGFNFRKKMDITKQTDEAVKKLRWYDMSLVKLSTALFTLMIAKLWLPILNLKWWVYLIAAVILAIKPLYSAFIKK
ncbi:MAG: DUF1440 domain-containing protein [Nanoarchaeota archaeon]|nr:DUF1440 domain-containing protein [Nanoarchaeota archaeon]